jgi:N utilization substance protein B
MSRRKARLVAAQVLYQIDMTGSSDDLKVVLALWLEEAHAGSNAEFAEALVRGTLAHRSEIDEQIASHAKDWTVSNMNVVDRNLLRLALFEMLYWPETPPVIALNEIVNLAKTLSGEEAGRFINGILHQFLPAATTAIS